MAYVRVWESLWSTFCAGCMFSHFSHVCGCCDLQRVMGLVYWPKYYQLEYWTHFSFLNSQGEAKGGATGAGWKKNNRKTRAVLFFFLHNFFAPLFREQESREGTWMNSTAGLTYTPGSIQRGEISLRTLAEVAANSVGALAHATDTWYIGTLIQVCTEENTNEFPPQST